MTQDEFVTGIEAILNNGDCSEETNMEKIRKLYAEFKAPAADPVSEGGTNQ